MGSVACVPHCQAEEMTAEKSVCSCLAACLAVCSWQGSSQAGSEKTPAVQQHLKNTSLRTCEPKTAIRDARPHPCKQREGAYSLEGLTESCSTTASYAAMVRKSASSALVENLWKSSMACRKCPRVHRGSPSSLQWSHGCYKQCSALQKKEL